MAALALLLGGVGQVKAGFVTATGITQMSVMPANFHNSSILSVAVSPSGNVVASSGFNIATVPFDGTASTSMALPFVNNYVYTPDMAYQNGVLNLLVANGTGPGMVRQVEGGSFPVSVQFPANRQYAQSFAFDSVGNMLVAGVSSNAGEPDWLLNNSTG